MARGRRSLGSSKASHLTDSGVDHMVCATVCLSFCLWRLSASVSCMCPFPAAVCCPASLHLAIICPPPPACLPCSLSSLPPHLTCPFLFNFPSSRVFPRSEITFPRKESSSCQRSQLLSGSGCWRWMVTQSHGLSRHDRLSTVLLTGAVAMTWSLRWPS